jgi:hypothetical protein
MNIVQHIYDSYFICFDFSKTSGGIPHQTHTKVSTPYADSMNVLVLRDVSPMLGKGLLHTEEFIY